MGISRLDDVSAPPLPERNTQEIVAGRWPRVSPATAALRATRRSPTTGVLTNVEAPKENGIWVGTARVLSVTTQSGGSLVRLQLHTGWELELPVATVPDVDGADDAISGASQPLAVTVNWTTTCCACSVLVTGRSGPHRREITLGQALALCQFGVHGVFNRELGDSSGRRTAERGEVA